MLIILVMDLTYESKLHGIGSDIETCSVGPYTRHASSVPCSQKPLMNKINPVHIIMPIFLKTCLNVNIICEMSV
jgi:hypothetical protein